MKFLSIFFLFFISLNLSSCNPFGLDDDRPVITRDRDRAEGERKFKLPDIKDIDLEEVRSKVFEGNCAEYKNAHSFSLLGDKSPLKDIRNCMAKAVDEGLKPLCDHEKELEYALEYYEKKRDRDKMEEIEELLIEVEESKYDMADELYAMADEFDEIQNELLDDVDEAFEDENDLSIFETILRGGTKIVTRAEIGGFTRVLDSRARRACAGQLDFSKIRKRK